MLVQTPCSGREGRVEWREELRHLASVNSKTCGVKTSEICRGPLQVCWFPQWQKLLGFSGRGGHWEPWSLPLSGWYYSPLPFFFVPSRIYTSQLWWSLHGVKLKWILHAVSLKAGEADHSHCSPFLVKEPFLVGSFLLALSNASLGNGIIEAKWSCSFFPFVQLFSGFLFHHVAKVS